MNINIALLDEKLKSADLPYQQLRLAAYLGSESAKDRLGINDLWPIASYQDWIWGLSQFKKPIQVLTCLIATKAALPVFKECQELEKLERKRKLASLKRFIAELPTEYEKHRSLYQSQLSNDEKMQDAAYFIKYANMVREVLDVTEAWLIDPLDDENIANAAECFIKIAECYKNFTFQCYECGSENDERALKILSAAFQTISAVIWRREQIAKTILDLDDDELVAKIIDGPALELLNTVDSVRSALNLSQPQMRELISTGLLSRILKFNNESA